MRENMTLKYKCGITKRLLTKTIPKVNFKAFLINLTVFYV